MAKRSGVSESLRWLEGYERLAEMAAQLPQTRLVYLADREADIMALMVRARDLGEPLDWLLRSKHNRTLSDGDKLWSRGRFVFHVVNDDLDCSTDVGVAIGVA